MSLPKIDLPVYECELPSTGKKIQYVPFTVKEEKILLTAQESDDPKQVMIAIKQILNNCLQNTDVTELAIFDIEFLLIQLRSKSVDNEVEFKIKDPETEEEIELQLDLATVKVIKSDEHTNVIKLSDKYSLFLKYPSIDQFEKLMSKEDQNSEDSYDIMISCIDKLASKDEVYNFKDLSKTEINDFVESLHSDTIKMIKKFFDTMPKVRHEIIYRNSKGNEQTFVIEGTQSFFI